MKNFLLAMFCVLSHGMLDAQTAKPKTPIIDLTKFSFVEGGTFKMGTDQPIEPHEAPKHEVQLNSFYIGKTEVTYADYDKFCADTKRDTIPGPLGRGNLPAIVVSWLDAIEYCNWLSEKEKLSKCYIIKGTEVSWTDTARGYRLPTEAEWEFAARGRNMDHGMYFSGDSIMGNAGWYIENSPSRIQPVAQKNANALGLYDMSGNVWEWVWDWYDWNYYKSSPVSNPTGPAGGAYKVMRGGAFYNYSNYTTVYARQNHHIGFKQNSVGFRIARTYFPPKK